MRKSPLLKENLRLNNNQRPTYLSKSKKKTVSLEKNSNSNRSLLNEIQNQTPNQPKKITSTQPSDKKLHNCTQIYTNRQGQILKSLMKIQNRTNPILTQQNCYAGIKLNFNNYLSNEEKRMNTNQCNSLNQTAQPSPKAKTISLSTYTSTLSPEVRDKEMRQEKITSFKQLIQETKECLENMKISDLKQSIDKIFDNTIQPLLQLKVLDILLNQNEMIKQIEKCLNAEQYQIRSTIDSLKKMEDDILSNEFNIIEYMTMGPFNEIMQIYQKRFQEHSIFTQQLTQQELVIHQFQKLHDNFTQQNQLLCKQLSQSFQTYLSLFISFQNKEDFYELKDNNTTHQYTQNNNQYTQETLFQTCETNNSIDEDQVIMKDQQVVRIPDKTSQFTQLLMLNNQKKMILSESPQFKN
ncbi:unnamed protein product (macronuclear) [Paramecium tetraurelia]|uniref:Uncharacterized protein n=1 Tax=Paramecium tetraurelia TaxID=5888 RepID=A0EFS5_PARTE|nr:uncharacterized protein GSPATT00026489001 [Paramecium tetraurelia]CAK94166.1 unnamed protein product [Paramecium tetraurelia]|eukprot:XP_001461539.1 hypothetical protein (macronuclear) [Paramecium tetraurelia strain d4-2]